MLVTIIYVVFALLAVGNAGTFFLGYSGIKTTKNEDFSAFQFLFLVANFIIMLADWLQGPYLYRLYEHYGYPKVRP